MQDSISAARKIGPAQQDDGADAFEFSFPANDVVFAGHFPQHPILPGIFQIEIVRMAAEWARGKKFSVNEIVKTKFQRPILPNETLKLNLKLVDENGVVSARANFTCGGQPAGEAILKLS